MFGIGIGLRLGGSGGGGGKAKPLLDKLSVSATSAVSTFRQLAAAYSSSTFLTSTGGKVTGLKDQSGNTRDYAQATDANRPLLDIWGGNAIPSILLDTKAKSLQGALLSALITTTTGTIVALAQVGPAADALTGSPESGGGVVTDTAQGGSIWAGPGGLMAQGFDGNYFRTSQLNFTGDQPVIMVWQHGAGTMYIKDGTGAVQSVALGAITYSAFNILIGTGDTKSLLGHVFEVLTFATMISDADLGVIIADMNAWITKQHMDISGFPSASNTGTTGALTPSVGDQTITVNGTTLQNLNITGRITVTANNVTIKNCRIANDGDYCVLMTDGQTGMVVQDCEILSSGTTDVTGIHGDGLFQRNNIHNVENGIVFSTTGSALNNYIHDLASSITGHLDGIECNGAQHDVLIQGNTILNPQDQTSAVQLNNDFGDLTNITVNANYIGGGGYTAYVDNTQGVGTVSGITFSNNVMERGSFGYFSTYTSPVTFSNNRNVRTGELSIANAAGPPTLVWTARVAAEANPWNAVAFGNGVWVAVSDTGTHRVMTSPDGVTWTARTAPLQAWAHVIYAGGQFVAVGSPSNGTDLNTFMTSPDGVTWTTHNTPQFSTWRAVAYDGTRYVAIAQTTGANSIAKSTDGSTWTGVNPGAVTFGDGSWIAWGNGVFVALSFGAGLMTSPDGTTWTERTIPHPLTNWVRAAYGNGVWVAITNADILASAMVSTDNGVTWVEHNMPDDTDWNSVIFVNGQFIAMATDFTAGTLCATSPDGVTWTAQTLAAGYDMRGLAHDGAHLLAAVGHGATAKVITAPYP